MKDYLDNEIGKIWLVLDLLCREGRSNHKSVYGAPLITRVCNLEDQIKLLQTENKSLYTANVILQNELNIVVFYIDTAFCSKDRSDYFVVPNPHPSNMADCNPLHPSKAAATTTTVTAKERGKLDMLMPQKLNEVTLHNKYSIVSDST